jgi:hypothetical protein
MKMVKFVQEKHPRARKRPDGSFWGSFWRGNVQKVRDPVQEKRRGEHRARPAFPEQAKECKQLCAITAKVAGTGQHWY